jgi:hypothetical protein
MLYTKKELLKLLQDKNVATTSKSVAQLLIIALDNGVVTREDILAEPKDVPKRPVGRPRKYPPKEVDPNKVIDPKYERLLKIRNNPRTVTMTNVETGETITYNSTYKAHAATRHTVRYFENHNGKVVDGFKIEIS